MNVAVYFLNTNSLQVRLGLMLFRPSYMYRNRGKASSTVLTKLTRESRTWRSLRAATLIRSQSARL